MAPLLTEVFGDGTWRYIRPSQRTASERAHLAGFDRAHAPRFEWPARLTHEPPAGSITWLSTEQLPPRSPSRGHAIVATFVNRRERPISLFWRDFAGNLRHYADLAPGRALDQHTYTGHVWQVLESGQSLRGCVGRQPGGRVEIH